LGRSQRKADFQFELLRSADDLKPPKLYTGRGAISCVGRQQPVDWTMGAEQQAEPSGTADICRDVQAGLFVV
jgi:hypothetical protein